MKDTQHTPKRGIYRLVEIDSHDAGPVRFLCNDREITHKEYRGFLSILRDATGRVIDRREYHRKDGVHSFHWTLAI